MLGMRRLIVVLLSAVFSVSLAQAGAMPACGAILCLSPASGKPPPPECFSWRQPYFAIRLYTPYYNASATAQARRVFLMTCVQARPSDIERITQDYGELFMDPIMY